MSRLFLKKVELSNFRVYGDSYTFDLPPSPGVTLIVGANGLGKTTLFDGIEWALTGEVSRFAEVPTDGRRKERDPLTRLGMPEGSHRVSLQFTDGAPVDRGCGVAPPDGRIAALLRRPEWPEIGDLHRYLSITHFLGQASSQRFSVRKPKDQWEALKGPAGVDRINYVKDRIGGQAARLAFARVIRETTDRIATADAEFTSWRELLAERDRLQQLSLSEEAMSPDAVTEAVDEIARRVVEVTPDVQWHGSASAEGAESALNRLAALCSSAEERFRAALARLQTLETLVADYQKSAADVETTGMLVSESDARRAQTQAALAEADLAVDVAASLFVNAQRIANEAQSRVGIVSRSISAGQQLVSGIAELRDIDAAVVASDRTARSAEERQTVLNAQVTAALALLERRKLNADQLTKAKARLNLLRRLSVVEVEINRLSVRASEARASLLREKRANLLSEKQSAAAEGSRIEVELRRIDERQAAMAEAVAILAARLSAADTECPLCATHFAAGELVAIVQARSNGRTQTALEFANLLATQKLKIERTEEQLREVERLLAEQNEWLTSLAAQRKEQDEIRQQLVEAGASLNAQLDSAVEAAGVATLEEEGATLDKAIESGSSVDETRANLSAVVADIEAEATRRAGLVRRRSTSVANIEMARAILQQTPDFWTAEKGWTVDIAIVEAEALELSVRAAAGLAPAQSQAEDARVKRDTLRQQLAADNAALSAANVRLNDLVRRRQTMTNAWLASGMSGEPDDQRLEAHRSGLTSVVRQIAALTERQARVTVGYRKWLHDEVLRERQGRINQRIASLGVTSDVGVTADLTAKLNSAQDSLSDAQEARTRMERVVEEMQAQASAYAERVLQPLNTTIQRFGRALMTWSDASIIYKAEHHATRSELRPTAVRREADGRNSTLEINPNLFFSEGQLSALSVSALFAASTTFDWSRWRCLLMDDPLQHNDVIHASAFMDVVRQLVRQLEYQIVMSTHDSAEAAFLIGKCRSAQIPFFVHELAPCGEDGLVSEAA